VLLPSTRRGFRFERARDEPLTRQDRVALASRRRAWLRHKEIAGARRRGGAHGGGLPARREGSRGLSEAILEPETIARSPTRRDEHIYDVIALSRDLRECRHFAQACGPSTRRRWSAALGVHLAPRSASRSRAGFSSFVRDLDRDAQAE